MEGRPKPATSLRRWCLICSQDLVTCKTYYSLKQKKDLCKVITDCVGQNVEGSKSQHICRVCFRKTQRIETSSALRVELKEQYIATNGTGNKENLQPSFTTPKKNIDGDDRVKRMLSRSPSSPSNLQWRKKVARSVQFQPTPEEHPPDVTQIEATITRNGRKEKRQVPLKWIRVVMAILENHEDKVYQELNSLKGFQLHAEETVRCAIGEECRTLCSPSTNSQFRQSTKKGFQSFSFNNQMRELEEQAPLFLSVLKKAATGPFIEKNKMKTSASLAPGILTAAAVLFHCRSEQMNSHQLMMGFTLLEGGCNRRTYRRLGMRNLCTTYAYVIQKQLEFGEGFDCRVKEWAEQVKEPSEIQEESTQEVEAATPVQSFQLVMDNVDMVVKARHTSREHYGASYHMANIIAIKNRVQAPRNLSKLQPTSASIETIDLGLFLPSLEDDKVMKSNWVVLMGHIIAEHIPSLHWIARELPTVIPHAHMSEARQKSEVVSNQ
ncbi:hypothetical protein HOLleu_29161 [Holothuria leucospilota]|uniref:Uncharacterized protein n=1 Tax=Holothuria leucospilota TaxID=206669 RepID=A0A9Q1H2G2_HOLLE|nr:hypothetical protein HOLleu_29161 [Holothuria leucospilota]